MRLSVLLLAAFAALPVHADEEPAAFTGMLAAHNAARAAGGVPPRGWSNARAREAQAWANQLAREDCRLRYDPDPVRRETTGQNLYRAHAAVAYNGYRKQPADAAERWLRESQSYDHANHRCAAGLGSQCGAYLQAIWETTTGIGCGQARCEAAEVWVCHYSPRGGQEGLKPYGNPPPPQASPAPTKVAEQQCGWVGPTPAEQMIEDIQEKLPRQ